MVTYKKIQKVYQKVKSDIYKRLKSKLENEIVDLLTK